MLEKLSTELIENIMDHLPVEIDFADVDDIFTYYNHSDNRIFKRTPTAIGKKVQDCHPQKSVPIVQQMLDDFKTGQRDVADFWIDLHGRLIYIRYLAVRDKENKYQSVLEVTQDITDIKGIEGEKRR